MLSFTLWHLKSFNNHGSEIIFKRISENQPDGFLGINIGPNKDTKNKEEDYFFTCVYYIWTINEIKNNIDWAII